MTCAEYDPDVGINTNCDRCSVEDDYYENKSRWKPTDWFLEIERLRTELSKQRQGNDISIGNGLKDESLEDLKGRKNIEIIHEGESLKIAAMELQIAIAEIERGQIDKSLLNIESARRFIVKSGKAK